MGILFLVYVSSLPAHEEEEERSTFWERVFCSSSSLEGGSLAVEGLKRTINFLEETVPLLVPVLLCMSATSLVGLSGGGVAEPVSLVRSGIEKWAVVRRW